MFLKWIKRGSGLLSEFTTIMYDFQTKQCYTKIDVNDHLDELRLLKIQLIYCFKIPRREFNARTYELLTSRFNRFQDLVKFINGELVFCSQSEIVVEKYLPKVQHIEEYEDSEESDGYSTISLCVRKYSNSNLNIDFDVPVPCPIQ